MLFSNVIFTVWLNVAFDMLKFHAIVVFCITEEFCSSRSDVMLQLLFHTTRFDTLNKSMPNVAFASWQFFTVVFPIFALLFTKDPVPLPRM